MITPRTTRLVRVTDLHSFREAVVGVACGGSPVDVRDRLVVVPTRAAAAQLVRSIESEDGRLPSDDGAVVLPDFITRDDMHARLAERLRESIRVVDAAEREVLLGAACRAAIAEGAEPPFHLRPGLIAEILRFYDSLRRNHKDIAAFERLTLGTLEPGALDDRGAERLVRQTRFLAAAFRHFERRIEAAGASDEHAQARHLMDTPAERPWRHVIVTVGDRAFDPHGLFAADWDLLARIPGLERLDVVATDAVVAGAFHERIHQLLPGIEEVRFEAGAPRAPILLVPPDCRVHIARDREEEVADFARRVRQFAREGQLTALDRMAIVVHRPLPYVYVAREVLRSAGIPFQTFDALPLAAEPYAAAVDLVFALVAGSFARGPAVALLRSPHFHFGIEGAVLSPEDVRALDRALSEARYLGDVDILERLDLRAAVVLRDIVRELLPLRSTAPAAQHLDVLVSFLTRHENPAGWPGDLLQRHLRARAAILGILTSLRDAYSRHDAHPVEFDAVAADVRRWIESHTFAPRTADSGVHLVDAASAPFGEFDFIQLAGLVDGEWPDRLRRNVFYSPALLRDLGWPAESQRLEHARAAFRDLLRLPQQSVLVSAFTLEDDDLVARSSLLDELETAGLEEAEHGMSPARIFQYEALGFDPIDVQPLSSVARRWAERRLEHPRDLERHRGLTSGYAPPAHSLSALERYQDCPFKFFAADVLKLEEAPEDEHALSPRVRGRFVHEVFQRFYEAWDVRGRGTITPDCLDEARALFEEVATAMLTRLPETDAALERARLFGSAISMGMVDVVLGLEAARPVDVRERWLEYRLEGDFSLGASGGRRIPIKGVADRIDLLAGRRLRVIDYKSGYPPHPKRALQVPIYALCAQERLADRDGHDWTVDEGAYVALSGKRPLVPVIRASVSNPDAVLSSARERLVDVVDGIGRGEFPPRPYDPMICSYCAYPSVCRKDYVD